MAERDRRRTRTSVEVSEVEEEQANSNLSTEETQAMAEETEYTYENEKLMDEASHEVEYEDEDAPLTPEERQRRSDMLMEEHGVPVNTSHRRGSSEAMDVLDPSEWGLEDAVEPTIMKDGTECQLRILDVRRDLDKNGLAYIMPRFEVVDEPYCKDFTHFLHLPDKRNMDAKKLNQVRFAMLEFCTAFGVDVSRPFNPVNDLNGLTGWAILSARKDDIYGEQNGIKKFVG